MRAVYITLAAATMAFVIDLLIGTAAAKLTRVPQGFPPFTALPILSGAVGGAVLASLVYAGLRAASREPDRIFFFVSFAFFALSVTPPFIHSLSPLSRGDTGSPNGAGAYARGRSSRKLPHNHRETGSLMQFLTPMQGKQPKPKEEQHLVAAMHCGGEVPTKARSIPCNGARRAERKVCAQVECPVISRSFQERTPGATCSLWKLTKT